MWQVCNTADLDWAMRPTFHPAALQNATAACNDEDFAEKEQWASWTMSLANYFLQWL